MKVRPVRKTRPAKSPAAAVGELETTLEGALGDALVEYLAARLFVKMRAPKLIYALLPLKLDLGTLDDWSPLLDLRCCKGLQVVRASATHIDTEILENLFGLRRLQELISRTVQFGNNLWRSACWRQ